MSRARTERLRKLVIAERCPRSGGSNDEAKLPVGRRKTSVVGTALRGLQRRRACGRSTQPAAARVRAPLPTLLRRRFSSQVMPRTCRFPGDGARKSRQALRATAGRKLRDLRSCPGEPSLAPLNPEARCRRSAGGMGATASRRAAAAGRLPSGAPLCGRVSTPSSGNRRRCLPGIARNGGRPGSVQ